MNPYTQAYTFANHYSQRFSQSLQKSMLSSTMRKKQKISSLKEKLNFADTQPDRQKNNDGIVEKQNGISLDKKEGQLVTCGIFYCRNSAEIKGCGSLQTSSWLDSDVLRNRQQKHTAIRYGQVYEKTTRRTTDKRTSCF